ncbi:hypothetical protein [Persicobacter psychrovividus]|uniref:MORN repeat variant n=1 Tax=Persicobacter psychrovividus TaxID=387638 RepID=A0ABN6L6K7_9BACT|nr:hypothetical protein PEPS_11200 [Persicobacter psychrovividus]
MRILTCIIFLLLPIFATAQLQPIGQFLGKDGIPINEYVDRNDPRTEEISLLWNYYYGYSDLETKTTNIFGKEEITVKVDEGFQLFGDTKIFPNFWEKVADRLPARGYTHNGENHLIGFCWSKDDKVYDNYWDEDVSITKYNAIKIGNDSLIVFPLGKKNYTYRFICSLGEWSFFESYRNKRTLLLDIFVMHESGGGLFPLMKKQRQQKYAKDFFNCELMNQNQDVVDLFHKRGSYLKKEDLFRYFKFRYRIENKCPTYFNESCIEIQDSLNAEVMMTSSLSDDFRLIEDYYNKKGQLIEQRIIELGLKENGQLNYQMKGAKIGLVRRVSYFFPEEGTVRRDITYEKRKRIVLDYFPNGQLHYEFIDYESGSPEFLRVMDEEGKPLLKNGNGISWGKVLR